jgi:aspartate aminotransferase-like enzyme
MHPRVTRAMDRPAVNHRGEEFKQLIGELSAGLQKVWQTRGPVVTITGSGTAAMDATLGSLLTQQDTVVALSNGKFGERMTEIAKRYAGTVKTVAAPWGQPVDLHQVETHLRGGAKALVLTHNETSCGFVHPLEKLAKLAHQHDALVIADCITSVGGADIPVDRWGVDAAIAGSQKCLGAPPGLAFVSVSERAKAKLKEHPSLYLDLGRYLKKHAESDTPFTPATHLYFAALEATRMILEEGLDKRFQRVAQTADATRAAADALGLELFAHPDHRSQTVTALNIPRGITDKQLRGGLKDMGIVVSGAQDAIKGKVFRVGHMGTVTLRDIAGFFGNLEVLLTRLGHKVPAGAAAQAIAKTLG